MANTIFEISPRDDVERLAKEFARDGRVQVRDLLAPGAAETIRDVLERQTAWGMAVAGGGKPSKALRAGQVDRLSPSERRAMIEPAMKSAARGEFSFIYRQYPTVQAYLEGWDRGHPLELILEHMNDIETLNLIRDLTGISEIVKADSQATLFCPGDFLSSHDDSVPNGGRRVAYVYNLARDWRPEWGGYLLFLDPGGDITGGFRPRFNSLNLFTVPQRHIVSYVPPYAPFERFALTGWFWDK